MTSVIIDARDLRKYFVRDRPLYEQLLAPFAAKKIIYALEGISFSIRSGEIIGVVGPNGAGKTTLLRILANLLEADNGRVKLCGRELNSECRLRADIGYVSSDERSFFWRLTGKQNLEFFACLYGIRKKTARKKIAKLLRLFALEEKADQLFRDYSTGTRKKFALVRALVHEPRVLLLDELTNSLDSPSALRVKSLVREYVSAEDECAAVWSTHRFEEIGEICDKILVINKGQAKFFGPVSDLKTRCDYEATYSRDKNLNGQVIRSINTVLADNR